MCDYPLSPERFLFSSLWFRLQWEWLWAVFHLVGTFMLPPVEYFFHSMDASTCPLATPITLSDYLFYASIESLIRVGLCIVLSFTPSQVNNFIQTIYVYLYYLFIHSSIVTLYLNSFYVPCTEHALFFISTISLIWRYMMLYTYIST